MTALIKLLITTTKGKMTMIINREKEQNKNIRIRNDDQNYLGFMGIQ